MKTSRLRCLTVFGLSLAFAGCSQQSNIPANISAEAVTPAIFNIDGAPTVEFSVPDMMCPEGCAVEVKKILSKQPGAKDVVVDFDAKTATVAIDETEFDADAAVAALVDHRFDHTTLKTADVAKPRAADSPVQ